MQGLQDINALFANGRDIAADVAEDLRAETSAERAGNFLLDLDHAQVTLGQVVIEGNAKIMHEGQRLGLVFGQAVQEVLGRRLLFASARGGLRRVGGRIGCRPAWSSAS